jgi:hypothetical protein
MKLSSLSKKLFSLFISIFFCSTLFSEEGIDIWKKENLNKKKILVKNEDTSLKKKKSNINIYAEASKEIEVSSNDTAISKNSLYGIYDPEKNDLTLDMWASSEGTRIKDTIERIDKIKLSSFAEEIFVNTLFTVSNLPEQNMSDKEFTNYKIDWLIKNEKDELITIFLNKNKNFPNKNRIIKYLIDKNIAKANIKAACEKTSLIDSDAKSAYLGQFKVICLINEDKKNEAQLLIELLREQKLSNKFFDNKINYLLGLNAKENQKVDDTSLLNFYLSSIAISEFNYIPSKKTNIKIWQYLTEANLINVKNFEDNSRIRELEIAANNNRLAKSYVLEVYKNIKFGFNDLLNIDQVYQTLDSVNARALVYQKTLLSDNIETKLKYLFLLNNLFKKENLSNIFKEYLSQELKILDTEKIPQEYQALVVRNIIYKKEYKLGKIKYSDKSYHASKVLKYYTENNFSKKSTEKELTRIHKKLKKNKKYQISLKDVILLESLKNNGISIPKEINYEKLSKNNLPPIELINLVKNNEVGLVLLRIVELIGQDELLDLDPHTVYFINYIFSKAGLIKLKNKILITMLPDRTEI